MGFFQKKVAKAAFCAMLWLSEHYETLFYKGSIISEAVRLYEKGVPVQTPNR